MAAESSRSRRVEVVSVSPDEVSSSPMAVGSNPMAVCVQLKRMAAWAMHVGKPALACSETAVDARKVKSGGASIEMVGMGSARQLLWMM